MQINWTIQLGQRLTTGPEQDFACKEVANYVKPEGLRVIGHNASEGIEPRNVHREADGPARWHILDTKACEGREREVIREIPAHILAPDGCPLQPNMASFGNSE